MENQKHWIRSTNFKPEDKISPIDRWILACLAKGLQGDGNISKISIDKIVQYCQYVDDDGKSQVFGRKAVQAAIDRLEKAGKIKVIKASKGKCTQYEIDKTLNFEKLSEDFFHLNLPPMAKGYILCALQYNLNKDEVTKEPNCVDTKTTFNLMKLSKQYNMPIKTIYKIEKLLKEHNILKITQDPNNQRDQETGLIIQNRSIDLDKVGLEEFVVNKLIEHDTMLTKQEFYRQMDNLLKQLGSQIDMNNSKEAMYSEKESIYKF